MNSNERNRDEAEPPVLGYHRPEPSPPSQRLMSGRDWIILAAILLGVLLMVSILLPMFSSSREPQWRRQCARHLQVIGSAVQLYLADYRSYPPDLASAMLHCDGNGEVLVCPSGNEETAPGQTIAEQAPHLSNPVHCSYIYLGAALTPATAKSETILVIEKLANHEGAGMNVLYVSGRVEWINAGSRLEAIMAAAPPPAAASASQPATGGAR